MPENIRLGCKSLPGTNALAYYKKFVTYSPKKFYNTGPGAGIVKRFTAVINIMMQGARYLTGDNLEVVWAEFSTLSLAVLLQRNVTVWQAHGHF